MERAVVAMVGDGPKRFNELRHAIANISQPDVFILDLATRRASDVSYHTSRGLRVDRARLFTP
jgi:hypothetical protein